MTKLFTLKNNKDNYKKYKKIRRWEIMKSLHKKIGAIVLSGVIIGGFSGSVAKVYANYIIDPSSGLPVPIVDFNEKFNPELYPKKYPKLEVPREYIYKIYNKKDVLVKGNDQDIERVYKSLNSSGFKLIKCSGKPGVIDDFVQDSDVEILKKPQLCFKNIDMFKEYIKNLIYLESSKPKEGVYRFMIGGFDGLFYFNPIKYINMFDQVMIDLYLVQRSGKKYGYEVLEYNLEGRPILKKYKEPMQFPSVEVFFSKMDPQLRKRPGMFGGKHGGIHEGGIYCAKIGDLIFLFRALS